MIKPRNGQGLWKLARVDAIIPNDIFADYIQEFHPDKKLSDAKRLGRTYDLPFCTLGVTLELKEESAAIEEVAKRGSSIIKTEHGLNALAILSPARALFEATKFNVLMWSMAGKPTFQEMLKAQTAEATVSPKMLQVIDLAA